MSVLENIENARLILDQWTESLADVLASMTDVRPQTQWTPGEGLPGAPEDGASGDCLLWWEQPFHEAAGVGVQVEPGERHLRGSVPARYSIASGTRPRVEAPASTGEGASSADSRVWSH